MSNIYHITNNPNNIKENGLRPDKNISEVPKDSMFINKIAEKHNIEYPIRRGRANFFFPSLNTIPYDYDRKHIVVININNIKSSNVFIADRDIRDHIIFNEKTEQRAKDYIKSVLKVNSNNIHIKTQEIIGTPEVIIHGHIRSENMSKIERGKFLS
jgi:hypothetical protein